MICWREPEFRSRASFCMSWFNTWQRHRNVTKLQSEFARTEEAMKLQVGWTRTPVLYLAIEMDCIWPQLQIHLQNYVRSMQILPKQPKRFLHGGLLQEIPIIPSNSRWFYCSVWLSWKHNLVGWRMYVLFPAFVNSIAYLPYLYLLCRVLKWGRSKFYLTVTWASYIVLTEVQPP